MKSLIASNDIDQLLKVGIGGKARNLIQLEKIGMGVPKWAVIPQEVLLSILPTELFDRDNEEVNKYIDSLDVVSILSQSIQELFPETQYFAVRSSSVDEDSPEFSFAGQFQSYLYVSQGEIEDKVKLVWKSAFSDRVKSYREENALPAQFGIAVIIQEMVNAEVAGVAFGVDPTTGNRNARVISSVYGLGEGLVSGELNADTYTCINGNIERTLADKREAIVRDESGSGIKKVNVPEEKRVISSLTDQEIEKIAGVLSTLQDEFGKPQDIEFAFSRDQLYLLQTRPITSLHNVADNSGDYIVWDNSNIIESYPGVTTPLTFSFIIKMYEAVYKQFCEFMGVGPREIDEHSTTFANMLGLIKGQVYYNLLSWYKVLALLPGYSINAEFMENMMGVKERFELKEQKKLAKSTAYWRLIITIIRMIRSLIYLPKQRREFLEFLEKTMKEYEAIDFNKLRSDELMHVYLRFEQILLKKWNAPLVNDFFAMIYFGTLEKLIKKWSIGQHINLHNDLHCGSNDIISTEPITRLFEISTFISQNPEAKSLFTANDPSFIWESLTKNPAQDVTRLIRGYLEKFGERCVGELKLETISYNQDPTSLIRIIKSYVTQHIVSRPKESSIEKKLRADAEAVVKQSLKRRPVKRLIFRHVLKMSRSLVSNRENLRYERTRGFGMVRKIFSAIGKQFYFEGIIDNDRDIFYLKKEEIFDFISGTSVSINLKDTIKLRKAEFAEYEKIDSLPERIPTYGIVYHGNDFQKTAKTSVVDGDLKGIGCCPGQVTQKVRVMKSADEVDSLDGDILVTSSTDPGWVTLFPTASAIIVERGSLLSHSAIVSRELGIPCIVGVDGLLSTLKTGDLVEMDGSTGHIKVLKSNEAAS